MSGNLNNHIHISEGELAALKKCLKFLIGIYCPLPMQLTNCCNILNPSWFDKNFATIMPLFPSILLYALLSNLSKKLFYLVY